jgi:hypothetical protein
MNETTTALVNIDQVQTVIAGAPAVLEENRKSRQNAIIRRDEIRAMIDSHGMSDDIDQYAGRYVKKVKDTITVVNEKRKPFTQMMDALKKEFTSIEADLKAAADEIQQHRDTYAAKKMEEQRERERQAAIKVAMEKERIRVKAEAEVKLSENFGNILTGEKNRLRIMFNSINLHNLEACKSELLTAKPVHLGGVSGLAPKVAFNDTLVTPDDYMQIVLDVCNGDAMSQMQAEYESQFHALKKELCDMIPDRIAELQQMEKADAQQRARMQEEQQRRQQEEQARMQREAEEHRRRVAEEAAAKAAAASLEATVSAQAELNFDEAPKVKESVEIIVKNPAGYALIFQFWFEREGKSLDAEKIERKTVKQMKSFCEAHTLKSGEIINSTLIEYREKFKAR